MRLILASVVLGFLIACSDGRPDYEQLTIETLFEDSLSIRAIVPVNESQVWFAANNGMVGFVDGKTPKLATIKYEDTLLHFRSIARNEESVFMMSIGSPAVLYKIDFDGQEATHIEEVYSEVGPKVFYDAMAFWNEEEGLVIGDPTDGCLSIIVTRDGGKQWKKLSCDMLPATEVGEAAFAASNSNIAIVGDHAWVATGGKRARVFHTPDKGYSWEVFETPILQGKPMTGIYSIDFYDDRHGIVFGGDWEQKSYNEGNKAVTTDGGKNWQLVSNGEGPGYRSSVRFVPGGQGEELIALGSEGIAYSDDFGDSWRSLSEEGFYALEFVNDSVAFASGKGRIVRLRFN